LRRHNGMQALNRKSLLGFGVGSLGTGIYSITPSVLLLYFMTDTLGVSPSLAALAVALPKFWDVVTDPVMGLISDNTRTRWGRRRPYLFVGAIAMSLSFVFLFSVPDFATPNGSFVYVLVVYVVSATAYTIFAVPYISMPAEMSTDPHERTIIMSYRMFFAMTGLLLGSVMSPLLVEWFGGGRQGYAAMSYIVGTFCALTMLTTFIATRHVPTGGYAPVPSSVKGAVRAGLGNKPFLILIGTYVLQLIGIGAFSACAPYYFDYALDRSASAAGVFFLFFFGATTLSMPLWAAACRHFGKLRAYLGAVALYALSSMCFLAPGGGTPLAAVYGLAALMGLPFGGIMMVPFSMLTDTIQLDTNSHGQRREGIFTGIWTAGEKTGLAFGPLVAGTVLTLAGFIESAGGELVQPGTAIAGIRWTFAAAPALTAAASLLLLSRYNLPESLLTATARDGSRPLAPQASRLDPAP